MQTYTEVRIWAHPELSEILMAELGELPYDTFTEEIDGLNAYIETEFFDEKALQDILAPYQNQGEIRYQLSEIEKENWNETWESNYEPIEVAQQCRVRASFHASDPMFLYEIVINPKMSFGTGHHETTSMMLEHQLDVDHQHKKVLDVGCGTGILAIMAAKRGAAFVSAFDIEEWAAENSRENCQLNDCQSVVKVRQGIMEEEPADQFEIVLANINRHILLRDMALYCQYLAPEGKLLMSGFYADDLPDIRQCAKDLGLKQERILEKNNWIAVVFSA
jgi:ribosomal protein L11 methyltransferase